jgi:glycine cleavage system aminomethyltransferase T
MKKNPPTPLYFRELTPSQKHIVIKSKFKPLIVGFKLFQHYPKNATDFAAKDKLVNEKKEKKKNSIFIVNKIRKARKITANVPCVQSLARGLRISAKQYRTC